MVKASIKVNFFVKLPVNPGSPPSSDVSKRKEHAGCLRGALHPRQTGESLVSVVLTLTILRGRKVPIFKRGSCLDFP